MANTQSFLDRLSEAPIVGDGAMGTYLHELGHDIRQGPEMLALTDPNAVRQVHAAYLEAGAELLETNTFGANALALRDQTASARDINAAAARLALEIAGSRAWVVGAMGPVGLTPQDEGWDEARVRAAYREQAEVLCDSGVHALLLETFDDLDTLLIVLAEARAIARGRIPIMAQMVFTDGSAACGLASREVATRLIDAGADVVGANCGRGLQAIRQAVDGLIEAGAGRAFVSAYPNAGYPERIAGRTVYLSTPAYLAEQAADWVRRGVRLVGGCCGTTPETIRAIRNGLAAMRRIPKVTTAAVRPAVSSISAPATEAAPASTTLRKPGGFLDALSTRLPIIAELDSPPHLDWRPMVAGAKALLDAGAQAISLAENPLASTRMDNFFVGGVIARETGKQVICHITCRDRNSLGLQSTLMGAHAAGIEAVLAITGDPAQRGGHQRVTSVYELNSLGLVRLVSNLNAGRSATGRDLRGATNFSIGVAFNSASVNFEAEVARLRRKQEAGAVFAMTQPVFSLDHAKRVLEKTRMDRLRVFLGFLPPITLKLARYLHHEVPGIQIPGELMSRLAALENPADQEKLAIEHTTNLIASLADELQGVYLITPGNRWSSLIPLIAHIDTIRMRG